MDNYMERLQKAMNESDARAIKKEELQAMFDLGIEAGIKSMMDKIQRHCELGKPVMANGELYFFKDCRQNLIDIMDDIDAEFGIQKEKKYIVPMRKVIDGKCEEVKIIITAKTAYEAWCGAIYCFKDDGWLVFSEYDKYEQLE